MYALILGESDLSTSVMRSKSPMTVLRSASPRRTKSPARTQSPARHRPQGFADSTFAAVQSALNKRQLQVSELHEILAEK